VTAVAMRDHAVPSHLSDLARDINENHELAVMYVGQSFDHAVKAGLLLIEAKAQVKHGQWKNWLKANVKVGARQASNYMRVAACPDEKRSAVADLSLRKAIHELAAQKVREGDYAGAAALTSPKEFMPIAGPAPEPEVTYTQYEVTTAGVPMGTIGIPDRETESCTFEVLIRDNLAAARKHYIAKVMELPDETSRGAEFAKLGELYRKLERDDASGSSEAAEDEVVDTIPPPDDNEIPPVLKRGRGRPPGSKNKPKPERGAAE
jgi:Protein of unknown function (DUF3102)